MGRDDADAFAPKARGIIRQRRSRDWNTSHVELIVGRADVIPQARGERGDGRRLERVGLTANACRRR